MEDLLKKTTPVENIELVRDCSPNSRWHMLKTYTHIKAVYEHEHTYTQNIALVNT